MIRVGTLAASVAVALIIGIALGSAWSGGAGVAKFLSDWQTLITGLIAIVVAWMTIAQMSLQIDKAEAAARESQAVAERALRVTIASQNYPILVKMWQLRDAIDDIIDAAPATERALINDDEMLKLRKMYEAGPLSERRMPTAFRDITSLDVPFQRVKIAIERWLYDRLPDENNELSHSMEYFLMAIRHVTKELADGFTVGEITWIDPAELKSQVYRDSVERQGGRDV